MISKIYIQVRLMFSQIVDDQRTFFRKTRIVLDKITDNKEFSDPLYTWLYQYFIINKVNLYNDKVFRKSVCNNAKELLKVTNNTNLRRVVLDVLVQHGERITRNMSCPSRRKIQHKFNLLFKNK